MAALTMAELVAKIRITVPGLLESFEELLHYAETPGDFSEDDRIHMITDAALILAKVRGED